MSNEIEPELKRIMSKVLQVILRVGACAGILQYL